MLQSPLLAICAQTQIAPVLQSKERQRLNAKPREGVNARCSSAKVVLTSFGVAEPRVRLRRAPVAQLDRALACGAKGRTFESYRVYHERAGQFRPVFS